MSVIVVVVGQTCCSIDPRFVIKAMPAVAARVAAVKAIG